MPEFHVWSQISIRKGTHTEREIIFDVFRVLTCSGRPTIVVERTRFIGRPVLSTPSCYCLVWLNNVVATVLYWAVYADIWIYTS